MVLPLLAIDISKLKKQAFPAELNTSHKIETYSFLGQDGETKIGFFKPLNLVEPSFIDKTSYYPELLAYYSVASSVAMRLALNDRVAEERLVFDGEKLIGTFSIAIPGFKPLANCSETAPQDEETNPSLQSLLDDYWIELLVSLALWGEDDGHADNVGKKGLIDRDMTFYFITGLIKGGRTCKIQFNKKSIDNFPVPTGNTYHPAKLYSIVYAMFSHRYCHAAEKFAKLAENQDLRAKDGSTFHEQMFGAFLKELLCFDPQVLRTRLRHYFGGLPFSLVGLPDATRQALIKEYPDLFDPSKHFTFVDHIMAVFEQHYKNLYEAIVDYEGCEQNDYGASVPSFNEFLRKKPSAFFKIIRGQLKTENERMQSSYQTQSNNDAILSVYNMPEGGRPNDGRLYKKYQQIWRDSFRKKIKKILEEFDSLIESTDEQPQGFLTKSIAFFSKKNIYKEDLRPFQTRLNLEFDAYFNNENLMLNDNQLFLLNFKEALSRLKALKKINDFGPQEDRFDAIIAGLEKNCAALDFQKHQAKQDDELMRSVVSPGAHNTLDTANSNIQALFSWLDAKESKWFHEKLNALIVDYSPWYGFFTQTRKEEVIVYTKLEDESPMRSFAEMICRGGCQSNSLNTLLIKNLFLSMLGTIDIDDPKNQKLKTLLVALNTNKFDEKTYLEQARIYIANNEALNSKSLVRQINDICYKWISKLDEDKSEVNKFKLIIQEAKALYAPAWYNNRKRGPEIDAFLKEDYSNEDLLAHILKKGGTGVTSFNNLLFKKILENIKLGTFEKEKELISNEERQLLSYIQDPTPNFILESLKPYAEAKLNPVKMVEATEKTF